MTRTSIDIDEVACATVMQRFRFKTKRDAVNFSLRALASQPLGLAEARALRGSDWEGDLNALRSDQST